MVCVWESAMVGTRKILRRNIFGVRMVVGGIVAKEKAGGKDVRRWKRRSIRVKSARPAHGSILTSDRATERRTDRVAVERRRIKDNAETQSARRFAEKRERRPTLRKKKREGGAPSSL